MGKMKGVTLTVFSCVVVMLAFLIFPVKGAAENPKYIRLSGSDRYETAVRISQAGWTSSKYAVLARGDDFPDALCAGPLAKEYNAPILLTQTNELNILVLNELQRLCVANVIIIGGTGAISEKVESTLISKGIKIERIYGSDRYETSVKIAEKLSASGSIALATGSNFPDALSVSSIASSLGMPILLTERNGLHHKVKQYIADHEINKTYVIGGQGVISDAVLELVPYAERLSGIDRFDTNAVVLDKFSKNLKFDNIYMAVADGQSGDEFADALAGSALAAKTSSPVVLVYRKLSPQIESFIKPKMNADSKAIALGGESVVPSSVIEDILRIDGTTVHIKLVSPPSAIKVGEKKSFIIETVPSYAEIFVSSSNSSFVLASRSSSGAVVTGIGPGAAVITVTAKAGGYRDGVATFIITSPVYNVMKDTYHDRIQSAIDSSSSGDMIKIASGSYTEHLVIRKDNLKLIGSDRESVIIDTMQEGNVTKAGIKLSNVSGVEIKNLTVRNAGINMTSESTREPYGIYMKNSDKSMFDNLKLMGNGEYEIYLYDGCDLNTIQNCIIDGKGGIDERYKSLDGIFCSGGESGPSSMNTGNKFINNTIKNVVYGISLTASRNTEVLDNGISASDSPAWSGLSSAGVILSNSRYNIVENNTITSARYGIRMSTLSSLSPYSYAGTSDSNKVSGNNIAPLEYGIRVMGFRNIIENNSITGEGKNNGIWITDSAEGVYITGNVLARCQNALIIDNALSEAHFNKFIGNGIAIRNNTEVVFKAANNYWGDTSPAGFVSGSVDYSPWLGKGEDADTNTPGFQVKGSMIWCADNSLEETVLQAANGDTIQLSGDVYNISSQLYIDKDITILGAGKNSTVIKIDFDTEALDAARGAITVGTGKMLNLSNLTVDGSGKKVMEAIRTSGFGTIENVEIKNIGYGDSDGCGIYAFGNADIEVKGSILTNIKKTGIAVSDNARVLIGGDDVSHGNTFNGSGDSSFPQYAVFIKSEAGNPKAVIKNNTINNYNNASAKATLSSSGLCILSGTASISNNTLNDCPTGIKLWTDTSINGTTVDSSTSKLIARDLESKNTYTGNIAHRVIIYDSTNSSIVYPVAR